MTAQMRAVTVRAAKINIVIGAILHQPLLDFCFSLPGRQRLQRTEAPRCEAFHTSMTLIIRFRAGDDLFSGRRQPTHTRAPDPRH
jgi:hypothetical protein